MKYFNLVIFCLLFLGCSKTQVTYWCGDHACRSIAEKDAYFKKTMTVEIIKSDKLDKEIKSELEIIKEEAGLENQKSRARKKTFSKKNKLDNRKKLKNEKKLAKQTRLEELKRIQNEKKLAKKSDLLEKKRRNKTVKAYNKKIPSKKYVSVKNNKVESEFKELVNKIEKVIFLFLKK